VDTGLTVKEAVNKFDSK